MAEARRVRWRGSGAPRLVALVLLLGLSASSCSEDPGTSSPGTRVPSPTVSSSGSLPGTDPPAPVPPRPGSDPVTFDFYDPVTLPEVSVLDIGLTDDVALTLTAQTVTARTLPSLEVAWTLPAEPGRRFTDLHVDRAGGTALLVSAGAEPGRGTEDGRDAYSVVEVDLSSGVVVRRADVDLREDGLAGPSGTSASVVAFADDYVVLDAVPASTPADDVVAQAEARHTAVVVELGATGGRLAWSSRPDTALGVVDGLVVTHSGTARHGGEVQARDLADGSVVWTTLPRTKVAAWVGSADGRVLLTSSDLEDRSALSALDAQDGSTAASHGVFSWVWTCSPTSQAIALCNVRGRSLLHGVDLRTGSDVWKLPRKGRRAPAVSTVLRDRAYGLVEDRGVVLDALTGAELASDTGAAPAEVCVWGGLTDYAGQAVWQPGLPVGDDSGVGRSGR